MKLVNSIYYRLIWPLSLAAVLFYSSGKSGPQTPWSLWIPYQDKVAHFFIFGLLTTLIYRCLKTASPRLSHGLLAILLAGFFGLSDELHQYANPHRYSEPLDLAADMVGALVAVLAYRYWTFYRDLLEYELFNSGENKMATP